MEIEVIRHSVEVEGGRGLPEGTAEKEPDWPEAPDGRKAGQARVWNPQVVLGGVKSQNKLIKRGQTVQVIRLEVPQGVVRQR
jgi:hypothetical protein